MTENLFLQLREIIRHGRKSFYNISHSIIRNNRLILAIVLTNRNMYNIFI